MKTLRSIDPPARAVFAMAVALLVAWALGRTGRVPFAAESLAEAIMARTPAGLANELLARLGSVARPSALLGGIATYIGVAAVTGLLTLLAYLGRREAIIAGVVGALFVGGLAFGARALRLPLVPNLVLLTLFLALFAALSYRAMPVLGATASDGRRAVLRGLLLSSAGVMVTANVAFIDAIRRAGAGAGRGGVWLFRWEAPAARVEGFDLAGLSPEVTPVDTFYRMSKNVIDPDPDGDVWRLQVGGRRWTLAELLELPRTDLICTVRCISNSIDSDLMSTATFTGVRVRDLLAASDVPAEGDEIAFSGVDGHAESISLAAALDDDTLVAYAMNGRTLTRTHGYPARLLIPGRYGFKNVKWLTRVQPVHGTFTGHWGELGWTRTAEVKTMARVDVARVTESGVTVAGIAFAGTRGVSRVQVQLDGGEWRDARLHTPPLARSTWVQWRLDADGPARVAVARAFDGDGSPQPEEERGQFPDGAQGLHRVRISGA